MLANLKVVRKFLPVFNLNSRFISSVAMDRYNATQVCLMNEQCILVDPNDKVLRCETKKNCHLISNINNGMLHRAFSVFLFDENHRLLLQQRSNEKITYPDHWTNSCCSHPLHFAEELDECNNKGIKVAARRRLNYELGINPAQMNLDSIQLISRIHYRADNVPNDGVFGEHEIDYVLFIIGTYKLEPNNNEVKSIRYVTADELKCLFQETQNSNSETKITPWFKLIADKFLFKWWSNLKDLDKIKDNTIHRLVGC